MFCTMGHNTDSFDGINTCKVYYSKEINPNKLIEMYKLLGKELTGNIAVKVHSGEDGNQNFLIQNFGNQ